MQEGLTGRVSAYYHERGYGFLVQFSGGPDRLLHRYELEGGDSKPGEVIVIVVIKIALSILMITLINYGLPPLPSTHRGILCEDLS